MNFTDNNADTEMKATKALDSANGDIYLNLLFKVSEKR
jgi:hypothetical protein